MNIFLAAVLTLSAPAQDQQLGARTKAMGGSYTAFEDDPVSIWLNPAGTATQPDALSLVYQTYPTYETEFEASLFAGDDPSGTARMGWNDPAVVPSFVGVLAQLGSPENPHAIGVCFASPYRLRFPFSQLQDTDVVGSDFEQSFYRFRLSYAHDIRLKPPGAEGFLTHAAVGLGFDIGVSRLHFKEFAEDLVPGTELDFEASDTRVGGGAGLLVGLYDNTRNFKVNLGAAWQSRINYRFSVTETFAPQFDWPNQYQAGLTFYLFDGLPLRVTVDAQLVEWSEATQESLIDGNNFEDVVNLSAGVEYRLKIPAVSPALTFYPRAGVRRFDAPWDSTDKQELPGIGARRIVIETEDDVFLIGSVGLGVGWSAEDGRGRMVDVAFDFGGDVNGLAFSFTLEL